MDLYRTFKLLGLKVAHPLRFLFTRFAILFVGIACVCLTVSAVSSSGWIKARQQEKAEKEVARFIGDVREVQNKAKRLKAGVDAVINLKLCDRYDVAGRVEDANREIGTYNTMLTYVPAEKREEFKEMEYITGR